jgi:hypothetical protein
MAANTDPIFLLSPNVVTAEFDNADGTAIKDLVDAGADGTKVRSININTSSIVTVLWNVYLHDGVGSQLLTAVPVLALAGQDASPSVELLDPAYMSCLDALGELFIPSGMKMQVSPQVTLASGKTAALVCFAGDY